MRVPCIASIRDVMRFLRMKPAAVLHVMKATAPNKTAQPQSEAPVRPRQSISATPTAPLMMGVNMAEVPFRLNG